MQQVRSKWRLPALPRVVTPAVAVVVILAGVSAPALLAGVNVQTTGGQANEPGIAKARITSVFFEMLGGGSPVIIVHGSGFGARPAPNPSFRPTPPSGNTPPYGCMATGKVGWDYGTQLWISVASPGEPSWSAGHYRPALQELDYVGITILKYSGNEVIFRVGAGYRALGFKMAAGDRYTASVKGAVKRGAVA